ncbi:relaxase/mobilization nuclease domain-containing protein [Flavitalea flava]
MNSKIFKTSKTFGQTCVYVCQDLERAEILALEGVRDSNLRDMEIDFETQCQWVRLKKENPVFHGVLSFPHGEDPGNELIVELSGKYLQKIGTSPTQYVVVRHNDKAHVHVHIVANRIDNTGQVTAKGLIIERGIKAAKQLTREYNLMPDNGKNLERINFEALPDNEAMRYRVYLAVHEELQGCQNLDELERRLIERGITIRYKNDPLTGEHQGISFKLKKYCFKGSRVDKAFSLAGLEKTLALQQEQSLSLNLERKWSLIKEEMLAKGQENKLIRKENKLVQEENKQEQIYRHRPGHFL